MMKAKREQFFRPAMDNPLGRGTFHKNPEAINDALQPLTESDIVSSFFECVNTLKICLFLGENPQGLDDKGGP